MTICCARCAITTMSASTLPGSLTPSVTRSAHDVVLLSVAAITSLRPRQQRRKRDLRLGEQALTPQNGSQNSARSGTRRVSSIPSRQSTSTSGGHRIGCGRRPQGLDSGPDCDAVHDFPTGRQQLTGRQAQTRARSDLSAGIAPAAAIDVFTRSSSRPISRSPGSAHRTRAVSFWGSPDVSDRSIGDLS